MNRRKFLQSSAIISLAPTLPVYLSQIPAAAAERRVDDGRILVVIQLDGGNDGINTVVPFADEGYARHRKSLRLPEADLIKVAPNWAFHPSLRRAKELFEDDRLAIVHGVGYPNPNRSHFESMAIWHVGGTDPGLRTAGNGWLGGPADRSAGETDFHAIHVGEDDLPVALRGRRSTAASVSSVDELHLRLDGLSRGSRRSLEGISRPEEEQSGHPLEAFVTRSVTDAYASAEELKSIGRGDAAMRYPDNRLGSRLKLVSQMIKSGAHAKVYYTTQSGYDTHAAQLPNHAKLLGELSSSLDAFMKDMKESGLVDRVLVMAFSEFGRRVEENASLGTDHGTAGPVFLAGKMLRQRNFGTPPSLTDLEQGDLRFHLDYRHVYASILSDWLQVELPTHLRGFGLANIFK